MPYLGGVWGVASTSTFAVNAASAGAAVSIRVRRRRSQRFYTFSRWRHRRHRYRRREKNRTAWRRWVSGGSRNHESTTSSASSPPPSAAEHHFTATSTFIWAAATAANATSAYEYLAKCKPSTVNRIRRSLPRGKTGVWITPVFDLSKFMLQMMPSSMAPVSSTYQSTLQPTTGDSATAVNPANTFATQPSSAG